MHRHNKPIPRVHIYILQTPHGTEVHQHEEPSVLHADMAIATIITSDPKPLVHVRHGFPTVIRHISTLPAPPSPRMDDM